MSLPLDPQSLLVLRVTQRLEASAIPYMISGSVALSLYVQPRMTRDVDIVGEAPEQATALMAVFGDEFYVEGAAIERAITGRRFFNAIHLETLFKIDVIIRKDTQFRHEEFRRRRRISFAGGAVWVVAPEDLLLSKLVWWAESGSSLQWSDLMTLAAVDLDLGVC